jgi:hypothetical protein
MTVILVVLPISNRWYGRNRPSVRKVLNPPGGGEIVSLYIAKRPVYELFRVLEPVPESVSESVL